MSVKELLAQSRWEIWSLSDCNWTQTHNHLVCKWTLNHLAKLAKWLKCVVSTYLYGGFDCMFLSCHVRISEWIHTLQLPECQRTPCSKQSRILKFMWLQLDSNPQPLSLQTNTQPLTELCCGSSFKFRFCASFEQGVPWHSGNYRLWIHSETCMWHDKNIHSNASYRQVLTTQFSHWASFFKWLSFFFNELSGCGFQSSWSHLRKFVGDKQHSALDHCINSPSTE